MQSNPSTDSAYIVSLIKFGNEQHMNDLLQNGTIYMNPINWFRSFEDANLRGDSYEGVSQIWNFPAGTFEIPRINYTGNYISMHLREKYEAVLGNIYSLYCISSHGFDTPENFQFDERMKDFGSHLVWIKDLPEFFNRMEKALNLTGLKFCKGFVEYYDRNKVNGNITVFQKPFEFEYQKEFRFYVFRDQIMPLTFKIGSLTDIAEIFPATAISDVRLVKNNY